MRTPVVEVDLVIPLDAINGKFNNILKQMAPFGPENQKPVFEAGNLYVVNSLSNFKDRHVKFLVGQEESESVFQTVGFDMADHYPQLAKGNRFKMAFTIEENTYNGMTSLQLRAKEIKFESK
jgi:single-stranded-DNA-specific exonuclease